MFSLQLSSLKNVLSTAALVPQFQIRLQMSKQAT